MTDKEIESELKKLEQAGKSHFALLLATGILVTVAYFVPEGMKIYFIVPAAVSAIMFGISLVNLSYFQRCPNCKVRISSLTVKCSKCNTEISLNNSKKGNGREWLK